MATAIQRRRGTTTQHNSFTGLVGEITIDTTKNTVVVHDGSTAGGHPLATESQVTAMGGADITDVVAGSGLTGGATSGSATISLDYENLTGNLIPSANNTYSLGSLTSVWKDVYVGPGSLYVNGQKVLEDSSGTIVVSADTNQNVAIQTSGSGDVELNASGTGTINLQSSITVDSGQVLTGTGGLTMGSNLNLNSNNINNLDNPVAAQDAATKAYVDAQVDTADALSELSGDTDDVSEGSTNLYFTDARARAAVSASDAGGDGSFTYNSTTGAFTYTGPSASETRAHFSAVDAGGDGSFAYSNGVYTYTGPSQAEANARVEAYLSVTDAGGDGSLSYSSGVFTYTGPSAAEVRAHISGGTGVTVSSGAISIGQSVATTDSVTFADVTADLTGDVTGTVSSIANHNTGNLSEGSNLYFTNERVDDRVNSLITAGAGINKSYDDANGTLTLTTDSASAGAGLTYNSGTLNVVGGDGITANANDIEVDSSVVRTSGAQSIGGAKTFSDDAVFSGNITVNGTQTILNTETLTVDDNIIILNNNASGTPSENAGVQVNRGSSADVALNWDEGSDVWQFTNDGSNYQDMLTDATARALVSVTDAGGDGSLAYNSSTGVITYTGPSAAEVRAHFSASTGISITDGAISTTITQYADSDARGAISAGGDLSYNSSTGVMSFTETTDAETRALLSGGTSISYDNSTGVISVTAGSIGSTQLDSTTVSAGSYGDAATASIFTVDADGRLTSASETAIAISSGQVSGLASSATTDTTDAGNISSGTLASARLPDLAVSDFGGSAVQTSGESFANNDTSFMTSAAIEDKILSYGYSTTTGDITAVVAGNGLTGGASSGSATLNIGAGTGISVAADSIAVNMGAFSTSNLAEGSNLYYSDERVDDRVSDLLVAGSGISLSYDDTNGTLTITGNVGDITGVTAGNGLTGGGSSGTPTLNVGAGTGISVAADSISVDESAVDIHNLSGYVANEHIDHSSVSISAGAGLTGGGTIAASRTINIGAGSYINVAADSISVDATSANTASKVVARDGSGNFSAGTITATATQATYADLAEKYEADAEYEPGTVVCFGGEKEVTACDKDSHHAVAGVISTDPAHLMNNDCPGIAVAIALCGRVPCKVIGPVNKGDLLVSSGTLGHAKADNNAAPGRIIGKAIDSSEGGEAVVEVLVNMM